ncbi:Mycothiol acetyltransferase [Nocardioides dokdonensis FR1436]|uniref:Mycothiol acetyltransferase n=1 Tax=Nocardioides dokdonensis FR1436 TaxID=1300347 RepID=A0A1A9GLQ0_9ACTN|nr:GNAT family protein [Nocardioides dokdonensis]ANH38592.1 Mycothiol acetyltransferase [Nocardioides dokdonensis FR1436]
MTSPTLHGLQVVLTPVAAIHVPALRRILATPAVRARWRDEDASPAWPFDDPSATRFAVLVDDTVRGLVQYAEEEEPDYRHASIDVFIHPALHGRGVGRDSVATLARYLVEVKGHHRLVIDPAADNEAAIRCYSAVGFRPVGILRRYERDADGVGWHDGLLMDVLAEELPRDVEDLPGAPTLFEQQPLSRTPPGPAGTTT